MLQIVNGRDPELSSTIFQQKGIGFIFESVVTEKNLSCWPIARSFDVRLGRADTKGGFARPIHG
jgi:hypothetical protein